MTDELNAPEPGHAPPAKTGGSASFEDRFAARLRGFGPVGILASLLVLATGSIFEPFGPLVSLVWVKLSHTPWREVGFVRPKSWVRTVAIGLVFGITFKFLMKIVVMPLLGADPINQAYHYLAGNTGALPEMLFGVIAGSGFGEETVFRGFLFERLGKLLGTSAVAKSFTVLITGLLFGAIHYPVQGLAGAEQAAIVGLVFGTIFAITGRILMLMVAHAAFDVTALAIIYWNLETRFAHLIFM
ncbi:MAG TPA: type II CAAX endopeptidase family protein [Candidatus Acidoferrales bacterium]|jgi:membrane protease YdiL (CAAX protease family)|nr:type II CAAX endopeptidase family protein [Candidatus Acidoferrales bacterium]